MCAETYNKTIFPQKIIINQIQLRYFVAIRQIITQFMICPITYPTGIIANLGYFDNNLLNL
jgi:hypothetical protein